jgi:addiction module HigA family antidote
MNDHPPPPLSAEALPVLHPGLVLEEKLQELQMGFREFALRTAKPEKTIAAVLRGDSSIPADMAIAFEWATGIPATYWLNHQRAYDEARARERKAQVLVQAQEDWVGRFPVQEMRQRGWMEGDHEAEALLRFFGMASPEGWEALYCGGRLKGVFGGSLAGHPAGAELSVWLRWGEREWERLRAGEEGTGGEGAGGKPRFKRSDWQGLFAHLAATGNWEAFATGCKALGVVAMPTDALAPLPQDLITTRTLRQVAVLQVTPEVVADARGQLRRLAHAVGHLALHGKKGVFIEDEVGRSWDVAKEREAEDWAAGILPPA